MEELQVPPATPVPLPPAPPVKNSLLVIMSFLLLIAVGLAGFFYWQMQRLSKELAKYQTQPSSTLTATPDPTANWKTYTNNDLWFTLKYPPEWPDPKETLLSTSTEVSFNDNLTIRTGVFYNQDLRRNSTFDEVVEKYLPTDGTPAGSFTIANREAKQIVYKTGESLFETLIMIPSPISKDGIVTISYKIFPGDTALQNKQIHQVLQTFNFLDQSNAEGKFCGGIAANLPENQCPSGFYCKLHGNYPDASGVCTKN